MSTINVGRVRPVPQGEHSTERPYVVMDMVDTVDGSVYYCIKDAPSGIQVTDTTYWWLFSERGEIGEDGPQGAQGIQGPQGIEGPSGGIGLTGDTGKTGSPWLAVVGLGNPSALSLDTGVANVNGGFLNFTDGITEKGFNTTSKTVTKSFDPTGVSDGWKYPSENIDGTVTWFNYKPKSRIDGFAPWFDILTGKWYEPYNLMENGDFSDGINDWTVIGATYELVSGGIKAIKSGEGNSVVVQGSIPVVSGVQYKIAFDEFPETGTSLVVYSMPLEEVVLIVSGVKEAFFTPTSTFIQVNCDSSLANATYSLVQITPVEYDKSILTELTPTPSFINKPLLIADEEVQKIGDDTVAANVQPKTVFPEGAEIATNLLLETLPTADPFLKGCVWVDGDTLRVSGG